MNRLSSSIALGIFSAVLITTAISCKKDKEAASDMVFQFKFDPNQERLGNLGEAVAVPEGHAAQSPSFNEISAHYIELAPDKHTQIGEGEVLYKAPETTSGGSKAIDFNKAIVVKEGETFLKLSLHDIPEGTYKWLRVSLSYQNYTIDYSFEQYDLTGVLASFIGFNNYISSYTMDGDKVSVNGNKLQGYWGFKTEGQIFEGQAEGTTVPNPIAATSPIPAGSCLVTGEFDPPLVISDKESKDIIITMSLSINNSFEWKDPDGDGKYSPAAGDTVVDMGIRGLIPLVSR